MPATERTGSRQSEDFDFGDGDLADLPDQVKQALSRAAEGVRTVDDVSLLGTTLM